MLRTLASARLSLPAQRHPSRGRTLGNRSPMQSRGHARKALGRILHMGCKTVGRRRAWTHVHELLLVPPSSRWDRGPHLRSRPPAHCLIARPTQQRVNSETTHSHVFLVACLTLSPAFFICSTVFSLACLARSTMVWGGVSSAGAAGAAAAGLAGAAGASREEDTSGCDKGSSAVQGMRFTAPSQSNTVPRFTLHVACLPSFAMAVTHSICSDCPPRGCAPSITQRYMPGGSLQATQNSCPSAEPAPNANRRARPGVNRQPLHPIAVPNTRFIQLRLLPECGISAMQGPRRTQGVPFRPCAR